MNASLLVDLDQINNKSIIDVILNIESIYYHNFTHGLVYLDEIVLQKSKNLLVNAFNSLGYYNLNLVCDLAVDDDLVMLNGLKDLPRIQLSFNGATNESEEFKNEGYKPDSQIHEFVELINKEILKSAKKELSKVRRDNLNDSDGFLIELDLSTCKSFGDILQILTRFKAEAKSLSLDDLHIAQQFSQNYSINHKNPFYLKAVLEEDNEQYIRENAILRSRPRIFISLYNSSSPVPTYSLSIIVDVLIAKIKKHINHSYAKHTTENNANNNAISNETINSHKFSSVFELNYDSISEFYVYFNSGVQS